MCALPDESWNRRLDETYGKLRLEIKERARDRGIYEEEAIRNLILEAVRPYAFRERVCLGKRLFDSLCGMDVLEPLMQDEAITDIMVNGAERIFFVKNGRMRRSQRGFESEERLEDLIQQIVGSVNRTVNEADPIADARLPDGSRVSVVLPPVSLSGAVLTIRKFRTDPITMEEMIQNGSADERIAAFLKQAVAERKNIFVCGATSSGKTTLLNILSSYIDPSERVITIEDSAELQLRDLPNVVTLETRNSNHSGSREISMRDLIKASLRMNPDRIIIGEVRDAAAVDMLSGLNTGHSGMSTGHANSCRDMLRRIENMVLTGGDMPLEAIRQQIASALDLMVFLEKGRDGRRRIVEIVRVLDAVNGEVQIETLMKREGERFVWSADALSMTSFD